MPRFLLLAQTWFDDLAENEDFAIDAAWIIRLAVGAVVIWMMYHFLFAAQRQYVVRVRGRNIRIQGKFPAARQAATREFLQEEFGPGRWFSFTAIQTPRGVMLTFGGRLGDAEKQRIRNFLRVQV